MTQRTIVTVTNHHDDSIMEPKVEIFTLNDPRPLQTMSEPQLNTIPENFRCYICQEVYKRREIGGVELEQYICRYCYPWIDHLTTGGQIKFDRIHNLTVVGYNAPKRTTTKIIADKHRKIIRDTREKLK